MDKTPSNCCETCGSPASLLAELQSLREENALLQQQVHTDSLTGLYNQRHLSMTLAQEMERTSRFGRPTSLIMLDLDYFKSINDTWGHEGGNTVLKQVASILRSAVRLLDIPCRYGGEEFAIILPGTALAQAVPVGDRLRALLESQPIDMGEDRQLNITASVGVDEFVTRRKESPERFIERADRYLYEAKRSGRNCTCHAPYNIAEALTQVSSAEQDLLFAASESGRDKAQKVRQHKRLGDQERRKGNSDRRQD